MPVQRIKQLTSEQHAFQEQKAAKVIQRLWRGYKVKETVAKSPYFTYLSLIDPQDEQRMLSAVMFGRHLAEIKERQPDVIDNLY